jgi:hypothetical protein
MRFPIFFMHVERCSGTSVSSLFQAALEPGETCPQPPFGTWTWRAHDVPGFKLYTGHLSFDFIEQMGTTGTKLIMLRHPLTRIVSLYDYWRSHRWEHIRSALPPHPDNGPLVAKSGDLDAFLTTESAFVQHRIYNAAARRLLGSQFDALAGNEQAAIAASIARLRTFDWVGINESFEQSVRLAGAMFDLPLGPALPRENSSYGVGSDHPTREPTARTVPTESQSERILEGNRIDIAIYEQGRTILNEMLGPVKSLAHG